MIPTFDPLPPGHDTFDVVDLLEKALLNLNKDPWTRTLGVFHPSALASCKRSIYYDRIGIVPVMITSADMAAIYELGHANHAWVQRLFGKEDKAFVAEKKIYDEELLLSGHCDGVFTSRGWILEIKTVSADIYSSLVRPLKEHVWQVHAYMVALRIPRAQILYLSRGSGARRKFTVNFDQKIWDEVLAVISEVNAAVEAETPPAREVEYMNCRECKFAYTCRPYEGTKYEHYHSALARTVRPTAAGAGGGSAGHRFRTASTPADAAPAARKAIRSIKDAVKGPLRRIPRVARVPDPPAG